MTKDELEAKAQKYEEDYLIVRHELSKVNEINRQKDIKIKELSHNFNVSTTYLKNITGVLLQRKHQLESQLMDVSNMLVTIGLIEESYWSFDKSETTKTTEDTSL